MNAARTRIGRVVMKAGGADVRVIHREPEGKIITRARELITSVLENKEHPSAFVGVFFWRDDDEPWRPSYSIGWDTEDPNLPTPRLFRVAGAVIETYAPALKAADIVMRSLGYIMDNDPDDAA